MRTACRIDRQAVLVVPSPNRAPGTPYLLRRQRKSPGSEGFAVEAQCKRFKGVLLVRYTSHPQGYTGKDSPGDRDCRHPSRGYPTSGYPTPARARYPARIASILSFMLLAQRKHPPGRKVLAREYVPSIVYRDRSRRAVPRREDFRRWRGWNGTPHRFASVSCRCRMRVMPFSTLASTWSRFAFQRRHCSELLSWG